MPCFIGCLALSFPRLAIILVYLFSTYLQTAYAATNVLWPILGFIFMPLTVLGYAFAWHRGGGSPMNDTLGMIVLVLAVLMDLGILGGSASNKSVRRYTTRRA